MNRNNCQVCGSNNSNTTIVEMCDPCYLKLLHSQWISVKERLPENDCLVLVSDGKKIEQYDFIKEPIFPWKQWEPASGDGQYSFVFHKNITHWMPMPPLPPKEEIETWKDGV